MIHPTLPMKYLKLRLDSLPPCVHGEPSHITFAYFGKILVDPAAINSILKTLRPFTLKKKWADVFGTVPVVVYEVVEKESNVQKVRRAVLKETGAESQNFVEWTPHISHVEYHKAPDYLFVTSLVSNDELFTFDLA